MTTYLILSMINGIGSGLVTSYLRKLFKFKYETGYIVLSILCLIGQTVLCLLGLPND